MRQKTRRRIGAIITSVVMIALALIAAIPLYSIVINTFKTQTDMAVSPMGLPSQWTLSNYSYAFNNFPIWTSFLNTVIVTFFGVLFMLVIGSLAAYGMILKKTRFTAAVGAILTFAFLIPAQVTLIPQYKLAANLGLVNTLLVLVIIYMGSSVFCYFLIVGYMRGLPYELIEAARIDGASALRIYWQIVLPLCRPILATVVVFETMWTWNDFLNPNIYINSPDLQTIVLQTYNAVGQFSTNWPLFMTVTVIALVPVFIFFLFCQQWIVSGLVAGSVKG